MKKFTFLLMCFTSSVMLSAQVEVFEPWNPPGVCDFFPEVVYMPDGEPYSVSFEEVNEAADYDFEDLCETTCFVITIHHLNGEPFNVECVELGIDVNMAAGEDFVEEFCVGAETSVDLPLPLVVLGFGLYEVSAPAPFTGGSGGPLQQLLNSITGPSNHGGGAFFRNVNDPDAPGGICTVMIGD